MAEGKQHVSIVICGHVDAGKSTTTGRLIFELGGIPEREMVKLREEAERLGKGSFAFALYVSCAIRVSLYTATWTVKRRSVSVV
jgi:elongation factor 1-alpha